jgi:hypothetical protein
MTKNLENTPVIVLKAKDLRGVRFRVYSRRGRFDVTRKGPQGEITQGSLSTMDEAVSYAALRAGVPTPTF